MLQTKGHAEMLPTTGTSEKLPFKVPTKMLPSKGHTGIQQTKLQTERKNKICFSFGCSVFFLKVVVVCFQVDEFERLRLEFERNQEKQLSLMDQFHPTVIQNNLKVAILEADEESEKIVEEFLDSEYIFPLFL